MDETSDGSRESHAAKAGIGPSARTMLVTTSNSYPFRIVLLTKPYRLSYWLESRLAETGCLAATIYEHSTCSAAGKLRLARGVTRREGVFRSLDILLYQLYNSMLRANEFRQAADRLMPMPLRDSVRALPHHHVYDLNGEEARAILVALKPDLLVVHATGILQETTFRLARVGAMNVHCGMLPAYRGHDSVFWALSRRDFQNVGVTVHLVETGVDTGAIVAQESITYDRTDTDITAWLKTFRLGTALLLQAVARLKAGDALPTVPQAVRGLHHGRRGLSDHMRFLLSRRFSPWPTS